MDALEKEAPVSTETTETFARHAGAMSKNICDDYHALIETWNQYGTLLRQRWGAMSMDEQRNLLLTVYPEMPLEHNPDEALNLKIAQTAFQSKGVKSSRLPKNLDAMRWPYLNAEDLLKPDALPTYIEARGSHTPWNFAISEFHLCKYKGISFFKVEQVVNAYRSCAAGGGEAISQPTYADVDSHWKIRFCPEASDTEYGQIVARTESEDNGLDLAMHADVPITVGLQILAAQQRIYSFLVSCAARLVDCLEDSEPQETKNGNEERMASFSDLVALAPYRTRHDLDFPRLQGYVTSTLSDAQDHIVSLREDPLYLDEHMCQSFDRLRKIFELTGVTRSGHTVLGQAVFRMITEAYDALNIWENLRLCLQSLKDCNGLNETNDTFITQLLYVEHYLEQCMKLAKGQLWWSWLTSPEAEGLPLKRSQEEIMQHFVRDTKNPARFEQQQFVVSLVNLLGQGPQHMSGDERQPDFYLSLDKLDTSARRHEPVRALLSKHSWSLFTQLSILAECYRQVVLCTLSPVVYARLAKVKTEEQDHTHMIELLKDWTGFGNGCEIPDKLLAPWRKKARPAYPIDQPRTKGRVQKLRATEMAVEALWSWIDHLYFEKTAGSSHELIKNDILGNRPLQRTVPWEEDKVVVPQGAALQPVTTTAVLESSDSLTTDFKKKLKIKTRGEAAPVAVPTEDVSIPEDDLGEAGASEERNIQVDKRSYTVFKSLFHVPSSESSEYSRAIKWDDFKRAMTSVGFSAEKLHGSAWQFAPVTNQLGLERGIQFHEPHPDKEIRFTDVRRFGRRLHRAYGWDGSMFQLK